jgi:hypothetical protein
MIALVEQQRVEVRVFLRKMRYTGDLGIMGGGYWRSEYGGWAFCAKR